MNHPRGEVLTPSESNELSTDTCPSEWVMCPNNAKIIQKNHWEAIEERRHTPWEESLAGTCLEQCMTEPSNGDTVLTVHGARPEEATLSRIVTKVIVED